MQLVFVRAPLPDATYWPGRRLLSLLDALIWPAACVALVARLPQPLGIAGPVVVTLAAVIAVSRAYSAVRRNHRYRFFTWRWARVAALILLVGLALKVAAAARFTLPSLA